MPTDVRNSPAVRAALEELYRDKGKTSPPEPYMDCPNVYATDEDEQCCGSLVWKSRTVDQYGTALGYARVLVVRHFLECDTCDYDTLESDNDELCYDEAECNCSSPGCPCSGVKRGGPP